MQSVVVTSTRTGKLFTDTCENMREAHAIMKRYLTRYAGDSKPMGFVVITTTESTHETMVQWFNENGKSDRPAHVTVHM